MTSLEAAPARSAADGALTFPSINRGYDAVFQAGRLSIGLVVPLESYPQTAVPRMTRHLERARLAEELGFSALWLRDVPFNVPSFGDAGQMFDPFVYLGLLAAATDRIALGVASIVLPLRHPVHVAKAAASADVLSGGRLLLGIASGDRPDEYPALGEDFHRRGLRFRESFEAIRHLADSQPHFENSWGSVQGSMQLLPQPSSGKLPLLITGGSQQSPEWIAAHGDGWMTYPRSPEAQAYALEEWRREGAAAGAPLRPAMQPLYVDLTASPGAAPRPIPLGYRLGSRALVAHLRALQEGGMNHVALNLRFNEEGVEDTLERLANDVLPHFD
ncbi:MAG: LLM class oxidoreductase [Acidobacteriota bacterium]